MEWLINLFTTTDSVAHIALLYSIVIACGVYLGKIKVGGISLGVTFVLFAGIVAGHVGFTAPTNILTFIQDFGLILFVFCIGLQVGPGFFESFRKGGITLNLLSTALIVLNIGVMFGCYYLFFDTNDKNNLPMMVGTLYGAVTNTPGLGAAKEALTSVFAQGSVPEIASGYACAYPLGVLGIIGATIAVRYICRVNLSDEEKELDVQEAENGRASVFGYYVNDPERYGVAEFDSEGNCLSIEEKPTHPKSNYAVVGLYFYPNSVVDIAKNIRPSARGELEITTVNQEYLSRQALKVQTLQRGFAWLDTGTHDSLSEASTFIEVIEKRQGQKVACPEEIALEKGWITPEQVRQLAQPMIKNGYGQYLIRIAENR